MARTDRSAWAVAASYLLLAVIIMHPLWLNLDRAVPSDIGDPLLNAWTLAWDAHALIVEPARLFNANIFYPLPNTLAYSEHMLATALLVLPLQGVSGEPLIAYNASLLLSFALSGLGMYLLGLRWTRSRSAAFVAGLAFAFAPYRLAAISHLQLLTMQWLPFSLLALDRLLDSSRRPDTRGSRATAAGMVVLFGALQVLSSWYLAIFCVLVLGTYALVWLVAGAYRGSALGHGIAWLAVCGLAAAAMVVPVAMQYVDVLPQLQAARPPEMAAALAAQPGDFLAAAPFLRLVGPLTEHFRIRPGFTEEHNLYPGLVIGLLAIVGMVTLASRPHRQRGVALVATLVVAAVLTWAGPYLSLVGLVPPLRVVRAPARWMLPVTFALAGLAGYGSAWLEHRLSGLRPAGRWRRFASPVLGSVIAVWLLAESFAAPLPLASVGATSDLAPVYRVLQNLTLASHESAGAVVELPMYVAPAPEYPETRRMLASRLGWWGLVNGYSGFTPSRQAVLGERLAGFPSTEVLAALRDLAASGVRYLVVHPAEPPFDGARWQSVGRLEAERGTTLHPLGEFGADVLYVINPYGDALVTDPDSVRDPYWSARLPTLAGHQFTTAGGAIRLLAFRLDRVVPDPGALTPPTQEVERLTLFWQTTGKVDSDYTVFVHSLDGAGRLIGQADAPPLGNRYPTTAWQAAEIVKDSRLVPAGHAYRVGLYDATTGTRLPATAPDGSHLADDAVLIAPPGVSPE